MHDGTDPNALLDAAVAATGITDFGDEWFRAPLAAWSARDAEILDLLPSSDHAPVVVEL